MFCTCLKVIQGCQKAYVFGPILSIFLTLQLIMQLYLKEKLEIMIFAISFIAACHTLQPNINKLKIAIIIIDSMGLRFVDVYLRQ